MESNIFVVDQDEITVHWKVTAPTEVIDPGGVLVQYTGTDQLATLTKLTASLLIYLKEQGFKPDPSKAARKAGGWPQQQAKPEQPAPDAEVPKHCAQPMKYVKFIDKNNAEREKYECRAGKQCPEGNQYGGYTLWRDQWVKKLNGRKSASGEYPAYQDADFA